MSSESRVRIPAAGRPRVPGPRSSSLGESGPKARPTGVVEWMNGSIFPYRLGTVKAEARALTSASRGSAFRGVDAGGVGIPRVVGRRRSDAVR